MDNHFITILSETIASKATKPLVSPKEVPMGEINNSYFQTAIEVAVCPSFKAYAFTDAQQCGIMMLYSAKRMYQLHSITLENIMIKKTKSIILSLSLIACAMSSCNMAVQKTAYLEAPHGATFSQLVKQSPQVAATVPQKLDCFERLQKIASTQLGERTPHSTVKVHNNLGELFALGEVNEAMLAALGATRVKINGKEIPAGASRHIALRPDGIYDLEIILPQGKVALILDSLVPTTTRLKAALYRIASYPMSFMSIHIKSSFHYDGSYSKEFVSNIVASHPDLIDVISSVAKGTYSAFKECWSKIKQVDYAWPFTSIGISLHNKGIDIKC